MILPLSLFAVAAVGGVVLAVQRFRGAPQPSMPLALIHGALAAAGVLTLLLTVMQLPQASTAKASLVLFFIAAGGGFLLFSFHLRKKALPLPVVAIHGAVAVVGFAILAVAWAGL